ncbi:unnamed protein product [Leuciscus chuanchicus]
MVKVAWLLRVLLSLVLKVAWLVRSLVAVLKVAWLVRSLVAVLKVVWRVQDCNMCPASSSDVTPNRQLQSLTCDVTRNGH